MSARPAPVKIYWPAQTSKWRRIEVPKLYSLRMLWTHIIKIEQQRSSSYLWLTSPLKLLKHQLNRHRCGWLHYWSTRRVQLDHSNHLLLLFSGLSDVPLRFLYMGVCVERAAYEFAKCVRACKCVQVLFASHACLEVVASKQAHLYSGAQGC